MALKKGAMHRSATRTLQSVPMSAGRHFQPWVEEEIPSRTEWAHWWSGVSRLAACLPNPPDGSLLILQPPNLESDQSSFKEPLCSALPSLYDCGCWCWASAGYIFDRDALRGSLDCSLIGTFVQILRDNRPISCKIIGPLSKGPLINNCGGMLMQGSKVLWVNWDLRGDPGQAGWMPKSKG